MERFFTKTFFKFCMGFLALLALSFGLIIVTAAYKDRASAVSAASL